MHTASIRTVLLTPCGGKKARSSMKCWTILVLQVLISAAEDTSVAPRREYCPEPPNERSLYRVHEDAVGDDGVLAQGTVLRYRCGAGYASSGPIGVWNVTCTRTYDGVLYWALPNHDCRPISCGHPGDVWRGKLLGAVFSFPNRVTYQCDTGYELVGHSDLYCQSDGNWDAEVPECRIVTCEPLENLANGFVETEGNEYGSTARYQCERGFRLQGEAERKCGPDGLWTGYAPTCQEVTCPAPEAPEGGTSDISKDAGPQRLGTVVRYSCPERLVLVGSRSSTCLSVGVWSFDPPKCTPPCEVPKFGNTLIVEEETPHWGQKRYTQVPPGTRLLDDNNLFLKCKEGYEYNGWSLTRISCRDGVWHPPQPWCKEKPCRQLPEVKNARVIGPVPHGQELEYTCNAGYRLIKSRDTPYCRLGEVIGTLPKCHQTFCNETGFPKEAVQVRLNKPVFHDGEYLAYGCSQGFVSTQSRIKCTDGRWIPEDEQPFCKAKDCRLEDVPEIPNGILEGTPNISHTSVIWFRCNEGYTSDVQPSVRCSYGKWEGQRTSCVRMPIAPPRPDADVHPLYGHDRNTYRAGEHPYDTGSSAKSPQLRSCKFPEREIRFYAADGNVRVLPYDNVAHGTMLRFHCRPLGEIRLEGSEWSQCIDGRWSKEVPYCYRPGKYDVVIRLKDTPGTAVSPDGYLNIDPRYEAEIECKSLYHHPRLEMIEPLSSWQTGRIRSSLEGLWRTHHVSAKFFVPEGYEGIVRCSNHIKNPTQIIKIRGRYLRRCKIPAHQEATLVTRMNKEIVTVACRHPYVLRGEARAVCLAHSEWEKPFPECVLPAPLNIFNGHGNLNSQFAKPVLEQTAEIPRLKEPSNPKCKVLPIENGVYQSNVNTSSRKIQLGKEFANGTLIHFYCSGDQKSYEIRCLEGFWKPAPTCPPGSPVSTTSHRSNEEQSEKRDRDGLPVRSDPRAVVSETTRVEGPIPPEPTNATANVELSPAPDAYKHTASAAPENKPDNLDVYTNMPTSTQPPDVTGPILIPAPKQPDKTQELVLPENMAAAPNSREQGLSSHGGTHPAGITATSTVASPGFGEHLDAKPNGTTAQPTAREAIRGMTPIENSSINHSSTTLKGQAVTASGGAPGQNETWHMPCGFTNFDSRVRGFIMYQRVNFSAPIPHNTTVQFHCEPVESTSGVVVEATCLDGKWTGNVEVPPKCDLSAEDPAVEILGATYEVGPNACLYVKPSQRIRLECKMKKGPSNWEVLTYNRTGETRNVHEGSVIDVNIERNLYVFNCRINEVLKRSITVRGNGQRFCTYPSLEHGVKVVSQTDREMRFACDDNLLLKGFELIRCSQDGQWDNLPPQCVEPRKEQTCDVNNFLSRVPTEVVIETNASEVAAGSVYHAFCKNTGYVFDGQNRVVCNADGTWGFDASVRCNRSCTIPPLAPGVNVVRRTAAEVRFACQGNLTLVGPEHIHCSRTGEWDATPPVCVQPQTTQAPGCDVSDFFTVVPNRVVIAASASEVASGAVFEAFCDDKGYILEGPSSRVTCKADRTWDFDAQITCVKGCPNFADQDERLIIEGTLPKYHLGDSITLSCPNGTELDPHVERITCLGDGWSESELPHCLDTEKENHKQKTRGSSKSRVSDVREDVHRRSRSPALPSF